MWYSKLFAEYATLMRNKRANNGFDLRLAFVRLRCHDTLWLLIKIYTWETVIWIGSIFDEFQRMFDIYKNYESKNAQMSGSGVGFVFVSSWGKKSNFLKQNAWKYAKSIVSYSKFGNNTKDVRTSFNFHYIASFASITHQDDRYRRLTEECCSIDRKKCFAMTLDHPGTWRIMY